MKRNFTLKWYIVILLSLLGIGLLAGFGIISTIWAADVTKISFLIFLVFVAGSGICGKSIWNLETHNKKEKRDIELGWFLSETLLAMGMTGTVIGFIIIMKDFAFINMDDVSTVQELIKSLGSGVSTALYTTLVGLIASIILKVQYFILEDAYEKVE